MDYQHANCSLFLHVAPAVHCRTIEKIALKIIQIALIPIDAVEQSFGLVLEGLGKDLEELPRDSESETEDPSIV